MHYDKNGKPMGLLEWAKLLEDTSYQRVAEDILPNGTWVSTVWLGLDHSFPGTRPPIIFETMVFPGRGGEGELGAARYSTEQEAKDGHKAMVAKWRAR